MNSPIVFPNVVYIDGQPHLPRNLIQPDAEQHRKRFPKSYLEELAQSIQQNGLQQPLKVRFTEGQNIYELVDGECRWRSTGLIAKDFVVPVVITRVDKKESFQMGLVANLQRLNPDPVDEANAYAKLLKENRKWEVSDVAKAIGKNSQYVEYYLALRELHPMIQPLVRREPKDGELAVGQAWRIVCATRASSSPFNDQFEIIDAYKRGISLKDAINAKKVDIDSQQQGLLLSVSEFAPSPESKKERAKLEKLIDKVEKLCVDTWDEQRCSTAVSAFRNGDIDKMLQRVELIEKHLKYIHRDLKTECARRKIATTKKRSVAAKKAAKKRVK